jgi:Icc-related predicted phosphoesterase
LRIRVLSDLHLEFADFRPPPAPADVVVLAGDIHVGVAGVKWAREEFPDVPVIYVAGNHEFYKGAIPRTYDKLRKAAAGSNVHVLENEAFEVGGVRFLGCTLWTDLALFGDVPIGIAAAAATMSDFRLIRLSPRFRRFRPEDAIGFHRQSLRWLEERLGPDARDVVVSHHAPLPSSLHPRYASDRASAAYASDLGGLLERTRPALWVHGHVHHPFDYQAGATRVVCNPRGYPGELVEGFRPDLVVELAVGST